MKSKLIFDVSKESFQCIRASWQSWMIDIHKHVWYSSLKAHIGFSQIISHIVGPCRVRIICFLADIVFIFFFPFFKCSYPPHPLIVCRDVPSFIIRYLSILPSGERGCDVEGVMSLLKYTLVGYVPCISA